jgi:hypothetical protein
MVSLVAEYLAKAIPAAGGRIIPILRHAEKYFAKQPEVLKIVRDRVLPEAVEYVASAKKVHPLTAEFEVIGQAMVDEGAMMHGIRGVAEMAARGEVPKVVKPILPADTRSIELQRIIHVSNRLATEYEARGLPKVAEKLRTTAQRLSKEITGERYIEDLPWVVHRLPVSPLTKFDYALGMSRSPVMDAAAAFTSYGATFKDLSAWWRAVARGVEDVSKNWRFNREMGKLYVRLQPKLFGLTRVLESIDRIDRQLERLGSSLKLPEQSKRLIKLKAEREDLLDQFKRLFTDVTTERYLAFKPWFENYADVRIALYREPSTRHWVESLMSPEEKRIAELHRQLMLNIREHAESLGMNVLDADKDYITHQFKMLADWGTGGLTKRERLGLADRLAPPYTKFAARALGSQLMYPTVHGATEGYLRSASRMMALRAWENKWRPLFLATGGHKLSPALSEWPRLQGLLQDYYAKLRDYASDDRIFDKLTRGFTRWMYLSKTGLSPSVARKHAQKFLTLMTTNPIDVVRVLPYVMRGGFQLLTQRIGVEPQSAARLMRNMTATRQFFETFSGLSSREREWLTNSLNVLSAFPTNFVEMFERGTAVLAALSRAQRKGLSYDQALRGMWELLLNHSFIGAVDRPLWLQKNWQQMLGVFSYTPYRIFDTTVKRFLLSLPAKHVREMQGQLLQYAWRFPKDVFGNEYIKSTIAVVAGIGLLETLARHFFDASIWREALLVAPFTREDPTGQGLLGLGVSLNFWPIDLLQKVEERGNSVRAWKSALRQLLLEFPQFRRIRKALQGEIYPRYAGSPVRQILALPAHSVLEERAARARQRRKKLEETRLKRAEEMELW